MSEHDGFIAGEYYFTARNGMDGAVIDGVFAGRYKPLEDDKQFAPIDLTMICVLVLSNGKTIIGWHQCESYEKSDYEESRKLAKEDALKVLDCYKFDGG